MNADQKKRAQIAIKKWWAADSSKSVLSTGYEISELLQELADAPEALPATNPSQISSSAEPFGYFKAEPFGWTDCAETDDGAIALYTAPPAQSVPDGLHLLISGAVYDFAGFLTTREKTIQVGARVGADIVVDLLKEWAALRGLKLDDAAVLSWQEWLSPTPPEPPADVARDAEPVAYVTGVYGGHTTVAPIDAAQVLRVGVALYTAPQPPADVARDAERLDFVTEGAWHVQWEKKRGEPHLSLLTVGDDGMALVYSDADARRIVACVNALAGVSTEHLEQYGLPDFAQKISDLAQQRDKLLAALTEIAELDILKHHHAYAIAKGAIEEIEALK